MQTVRKRYPPDSCGCKAKGKLEPAGRDGVSASKADPCCAPAFRPEKGAGPETEEKSARNSKGTGEDAPASDRFRTGVLLLGIVLFAAGMVFRFPAKAESVLFLSSFLLAGGEILFEAGRDLVHGRLLNENFLMSVATLGALALGKFAEGAAVMIFYRIGEFFEDLAVRRSRKSISRLMDLRPGYANRIREDGTAERVPPEDISVGERILVRPGEKIPLDGEIEKGRSSLDTSALTGESLPRGVETGNEVLSGSVNRDGALTVKVTRKFEESASSKILELVRDAGSRKARTEKFITRFSRIYTPAVVFSAAALAVLPPLFLPGAGFSEWAERALTFLVVSCPCALVLSVPLGFFAGIGGASRKGILVKGGACLEALSKVDTVVFDKTGTLTKGNFCVSKISPAREWTRDDLLCLAAHAERYSIHPAAAAIRSAWGKNAYPLRIEGVREIPGEGVTASVDGKTVLAGNASLMDGEKIEHGDPFPSGTTVFFAVDGVYAGKLSVADEVRPESVSAVQKLRSAGVRRIIMLTGDSKETAGLIAGETGLDDFHAELLPAGKVEWMEKIAREVPPGRKMVFVGDGTNDAPALARADIGVAMGGIGTDAALESADVVLMSDDPSRLETAIRIARHTCRIVRQNVVFALGVKFTILALAAFGLTTMWAAVFGDVGVAILDILNSARAAFLRDSD